MSTVSVSDACYLPNLPGFRSKEIPTGAKKQYFHFVRGEIFMKDEGLPQLADDMSLTSSMSRPSTKQNMNAINIVLTFQAYFEEQSSYSTAAIDQSRVRKCNIFYFLENNTISIVEKPVMNSGIPQGTLVRRSVVNHPDGSPILPQDFQMGGTLAIFGKNYVIYDCDEATRKYMRRHFGVNDNMSLVPPKDPYVNYRKSLEKGPSDDWNEYRVKKNANKTFVEAALGKGVDNKGREGFIKFGTQKLSFKCVWDNTNQLYGDRQEFSLVYSLSDDTIEIFSLPNSSRGKSEFTKLLRRAKLPKKDGDMVVGERREDLPCYNWKDLKIGVTLNVYARDLRIVDADSPTREFYVDANMPLGVSEYEDEVSLGTHSMLESQAPEIKPSTAAPSTKIDPNSNKMLSFFASLLSGGLDDVNRRFVIIYYVQNGTIKILEEKIRNSGFAGGLFLSRRKIQKMGEEPGNFLNDRDLYVGCKLGILNHRFLLDGANESTLRFLEDQKYPRSSFYTIIGKIRNRLLNEAKSGDVVRRFEAREDRPNFISIDGARTVFIEYGLIGDEDFQLSNHELLTILRANGNKESTFNYRKVIDQITNPTDAFK